MGNHRAESQLDQIEEQRGKPPRSENDTTMTTTICFCISCFPKMGTPISRKTPWCLDKKCEQKKTPALLNDLPDDLLSLIRSMLKQMVKKEKPYKLPRHHPCYDLYYYPEKVASVQWERQGQAIAMTTKKGVFTWDKKKSVCQQKVWRCEECFAETIEKTLCFKCSNKFEEEDDYYFNAPLSTLLKQYNKF